MTKKLTRAFILVLTLALSLTWLVAGLYACDSDDVIDGGGTFIP